ncbi:MAG: DUF3108 domain-containing protein [Balneolaceae bacterium]
MMKTHSMHLWIKAGVFFPVLFLIALNGFTQELTYENDEPPTLEELIDAREVFEYEVRYGFFTLGWVDVEILPDTTFAGEKAYHMRTRIRSNRKVPFVGTRIVNYENIFNFNDEFMYSHEFWRDDVHDENYDRVRISFDREKDLVYFFEEGEPTDTLDLVEPASGGDVIFYFSRLFAGTDESYTLPIYTEDEMGEIGARNSGDTEMRSYDAFEDDVEAYYSEGETNIEGPFGFSGRFKAWFSTDDLRIPLEAHVRVIFGNVKVKLISYERHDTN